VTGELPVLPAVYDLHLVSRDAADRTVVEWMAGLRGSGVQRDNAVAELRDLLLRVARFECERRRGLLRVRGPELEDIAQQAANDALVSIMAKLDEFRGESRFTTWAYKFVMFEVSTKIGRHFWRTGSATVAEPVDPDRIADRLATPPDQRAEHRELLGALARAVEQDLTEHQRKVFVAIALDDVPADALAAELGSNRNAVYKALFDARRKLRASLAGAGYAVSTAPEPQ
jgi:RNA polymerase sigma-70 factor, ECF subfamily